MSESLHDVFADSAFWIALVVKQDQHHTRAASWSLRIDGTITTTIAVLLETANALARPTWRAHGVRIIDHLLQRTDVDVVALSDDLWRQGLDLYRNRSDKAWSLTDCISFLVMQAKGITDAMTTDDHFRQAGFAPYFWTNRLDRFAAPV